MYGSPALPRPLSPCPKPGSLASSPLQCDQIGQFIELWATFQSLWQQLICPNHLGNFCKGVKSFNFLLKSCLDNFLLVTLVASHTHTLTLIHTHTPCLPVGDSKSNLKLDLEVVVVVFVVVVVAAIFSHSKLSPFIRRRCLLLTSICQISSL